MHKAVQASVLQARRQYTPPNFALKFVLQILALSHHISEICYATFDKTCFCVLFELYTLGFKPVYLLNPVFPQPRDARRPSLSSHPVTGGMLEPFLVLVLAVLVSAFVSPCSSSLLSRGCHTEVVGAGPPRWNLHIRQREPPSPRMVPSTTGIT